MPLRLICICCGCEGSIAVRVMLRATCSPRGPVTSIIPPPLCGSNVHPSGMPIVAELSDADTVCRVGTGPEFLDAGEAEAGAAELWLAGLLAATAPPGCHALNSSFNMGFTVLPKRDASSDTKPASTCGPFIAATTSPATLALPAAWFTTVKNTPTISVPRNLNTRPICGRSPQLACTARNTEAMPAAWVVAPSTTPYMILPPSGELTVFSGVCAGAEYAQTINKLNSNPASPRKHLWIRITTTSSSFIAHPQRNLAGFLQQAFE